MGQPDRRVRAVAKFAYDLVLSIIEDVAQMHRMITAWAVILYPFAGQRDVIETSFLIVW